MPPAIRDERGFTLIELLVVILIIGILAAIALPSLLGQRQKAQDSDAKSNARNLATAIEACFTTEQDYTKCPSSAVEADLPIGSGEGQVDAAVSATGFTVTATSKSGGVFEIVKALNSPFERTCDDTSAGCNGGSW